MNLPFSNRVRLFIIRQFVGGLNFILSLLNRFLFRPAKEIPRNIVIYKVGNIGDIVCAVPAFIAIRRFYPEAKITLLTSPGKIGGPGAKELLSGVWYLDDLDIYYGEDVDSWRKKLNFAKKLRERKYDLFIQLPDDLANLRTLLRNMVFAKLSGAESAFGFKIRTIQLFKKTRVDYTTQKTEVASLLDLLEENGIKAEKAEFDFDVSAEQKNKTEKLLKKKWPRLAASKKSLIAVSPGGKRGSNRWPTERFAELAKYLSDKYGAKIIVVGGKEDIEKAETIKAAAGEKSVLIACGEFGLMETFEVLKRCSFLISNSTGNIHLAAAAGIPAVGLYGVRDIFGRWFPYGSKHKILYHKFLDCDYRKEDCIKKSIEMISVEEAKNACGELMENISFGGRENKT